MAADPLPPQVETASETAVEMASAIAVEKLS
jgi:hypothetical protein